MQSSAHIRIVPSQTFHGRKGRINNEFRYGFLSILVPVHPEIISPSRLLKIDGKGIYAFREKDYGDGNGLYQYSQKMSHTYGFSNVCDGPVWLLTQPRWLGYVFNPVSFWFFTDKNEKLRVVLAEVNNTFGERHTYLCHNDEFGPIEGHDRVQAQKLFHVSPFQDVSGEYSFRFKFGGGIVAAWIDYSNDDNGIYATITGAVNANASTALIKNFLLQPFGALRVMALIHWQALKLKLKGANYRRLPTQNPQKVSR